MGGWGGWRRIPNGNGKTIPISTWLACLAPSRRAHSQARNRHESQSQIGHHALAWSSQETNRHRADIKINIHTMAGRHLAWYFLRATLRDSLAQEGSPTNEDFTKSADWPSRASRARANTDRASHEATSSELGTHSLNPRAWHIRSRAAPPIMFNTTLSEQVETSLLKMKKLAAQLREHLILISPWARRETESKNGSAKVNSEDAQTLTEEATRQHRGN